MPYKYIERNIKKIINDNPQFITSSLWSFVSVIFKALSILTVNKLLAVFYGPAGITLFSHFQNLITIINTVPNGGINAGLMKFLSIEDPQGKRYAEHFYAGLFLNILFWAFAFILLFFNKKDFLEVFIKSGFNLNEWLLIFAGLNLLLILHYFFISVLLAMQKVKKYILINIITSLLVLIIVLIASYYFSLSTWLIAYLIGQSVTIFLSIFFLLKNLLIPPLKFFLLKKKSIMGLGKFILMSLSTVLFVKLVDFYIREYIILKFNMYYTGLWQSVVRISESYIFVFSSIMGVTYYPRVFALIDKFESLKQFVKRVFYLLTPVIFILLLFVYFFREEVIILLFQEEFLKAAYLLDFQMIGDFFLMSSFLLSIMVTAKANVPFYILMQFLSMLIYVLLIFFFTSYYGIQGMTMAHAARYFLFFVFNVIYFRRIIMS